MRSRLDVRKYSFCCRIVDIWNKLPEHVISAKTVHSFKRRLDKFLSDQPIKYQFTECLKFIGGIQDNSSDKNEELALKDGDTNLLQK
ncbi:hypothetical protein DPMN_170363 [Dreissena polymorpha]|uniref:Uncharacterized protein n=1 Tax=Dreissena polymorpha TaxID=45954 RepID=A0A9D4ICT5_DREPO|nr:hypothetical protein DPMN_170363 [Dreissena polymorpha]